MAAFQVVIGFRGMQNTSAAGVDHHQLARADAAFLDHFIICGPRYRLRAQVISLSLLMT